MPAPYKSLADRVSAIYARTRPEGGCLVTTGPRKTEGYAARVSFQGREYPAHVLVARHFLGPCPDGKEVMHMCHRGREGCVTGSHLRYGTRSENLAHASSAKRIGSQKLSPAQVLEIRAALSRKQSLRSLARQYGVTKGTISHIKARRNYAWLR